MMMYAALLVIFTIMSNSCGGAPSKVLILGGNGMLGSATVTALLRSFIRYDITILNRGNWYWDTEKVIKPYVTHVRCTRGEGFRETCTQLEGAMFDTIIDFSTYDSLDMEDILIVFENRFKRYIYISTYSVYEVCKPKAHAGYLKETDAVRDEGSRNQLNEGDDYGHKKLEGEEVLARYHQARNYEFISIRLPDVLGPRDNTIRFYKYFLWTKLHKVIGAVHIPNHLQDRPLSFVYSVDVGSLIAKLANPVNNSYTQLIFNHAYNVAFKETITLKQLLTFIGGWVKNGDTKFNESGDASRVYFPSVKLGPVNITKAATMMNWSPTGIYEALADICEFYEKMQYDPEHRYMLNKVLNALHVRGDKYRDFVNLHKRKIIDEEL